MSLVRVTALACLFLLTGCWTAETRLMPQSEKVSLPIAGSYEEGSYIPEFYATVRELSLYDYEFVKTKNGEETRYGFSLDRIEASELKYLAPNLSKYNAVLMLETHDLEGVVYGLLLVAADDKGIPIRLSYLIPNCSKAIRDVYGFGSSDCKFSSYAQLRKAMLDVVQALEDPLLPPQTTDLLRRRK